MSLHADTAANATSLSSAITDNAGAFALTAPSTGRFYVKVRRLGFEPAGRAVEVRGDRSDSLEIRLESYEAFVRRRDSLATVQHWQRVAAARARRRRWVCGLPAAAARAQAESVYREFAGSEFPGMRSVPAQYGMPHEHDAFIREFTRPLSPRACAAFARGLDRTEGLETDTIRVFRFGRALFLPDYGDGGAFADSTGKLLTIFIVPS